jgi:hypothetical protein
MPKLTGQYNYRFTPEQYARLEALAAQTNSVARSGPTARLPSVSTLFARIADGAELTVVEVKPWSLPAGLAEAAGAVEERQREQERLEEQRRSVAAHPMSPAASSLATQAAEKKQAQKTPLKLQQLNMLELEPA